MHDLLIPESLLWIHYGLLRKKHRHQNLLLILDLLFVVIENRRYVYSEINYIALDILNAMNLCPSLMNIATFFCYAGTTYMSVTICMSSVLGFVMKVECTTHLLFFWGGGIQRYVYVHNHRSFLTHPMPKNNRYCLRCSYNTVESRYQEHSRLLLRHFMIMWHYHLQKK